MFANRNFDPTEERFDADAERLRRRRGARCAKCRSSTTRTSAAVDAADTPPSAARPSTRSPRSEPKRCASGRCGPRSSSSATSTAKLRAIAAYRPLVHAGWVQPGLPEADAEPFDLKMLGVVNPRGTVRVHLSRFLHITLDLTYQADADAGDPASRPSDGLDELVLAPRYHLVGDAQRAQQRAALLRSSGVRSARARDAAARARRARAAGRRPELRSLGENGAGRRVVAARVRERARDTGSGSSCAPGGQPMTITRVVDIAARLRRAGCAA